MPFSFDNKELSNNPLYYFNHNFVSFLILISGLVLFSLTTLWGQFLNGIMLGAIFAGVSAAKTIQEATASIIFHGIFEILAIIISGAIGLYPCYIIYEILGNAERINLKEHIKKILGMILLAVTLLFVASILEATVSTYIIRNLL